MGKAFWQKTRMADIASYLPTVPGNWVKHIAQAGLLAKGILYGLLGILAFMEAFEMGSPMKDIGRKGVLSFIEDLVIGRILLGLVAAGLLCYCLWKLLQALKDTENHGTSLKGIAFRVRYASVGGTYALLAFVAAELVFDTDGDNGSASIRQKITAELLQSPVGHWLVIGSGIVIAIGGAFFIYLGLTDRYQKRIKKVGLKHHLERVMIKAGRVGYLSRGIVWIIVGYLFIKAAFDAREGGHRNAFRFMENSFYGSYLLGAVAVGMICYSLFVFMEAKFQVNSKREAVIPANGRSGR